MNDTRPQATAVARIAAVRRYLEDHADAEVSLAALGAIAGLSPHYLQRSFKAIMGVTPKQYHAACRLRLLKDRLRRERSATDAIYAAGYGSSSRVYEGVDATLGMTPRQYRHGGAGVEISHAQLETPLGPLLIGATDRGVCFVQFGDDEAALLAGLRREFPCAVLRPTPPGASGLIEWRAAIADFLGGRLGGNGVVLDVAGTPFQLLVWNYLRHIPCGAVRTYADVARAIGRPQAVRAVAGACAANRVALLIPCHRVIRCDGGLGGYRWGLERKRALLDLEAAGCEGS